MAAPIPLDLAAERDSFMGVVPKATLQVALATCLSFIENFIGVNIAADRILAILGPNALLALGGIGARVMQTLQANYAPFLLEPEEAIVLRGPELPRLGDVTVPASERLDDDVSDTALSPRRAQHNDTDAMNSCLNPVFLPLPTATHPAIHFEAPLLTQQPTDTAASQVETTPSKPTNIHEHTAQLVIGLVTFLACLVGLAIRWASNRRQEALHNIEQVSDEWKPKVLNKIAEELSADDQWDILSGLCPKSARP